MYVVKYCHNLQLISVYFKLETKVHGRREKNKQLSVEGACEIDVFGNHVEAEQSFSCTQFLTPWSFCW